MSLQPVAGYPCTGGHPACWVVNDGYVSAVQWNLGLGWVTLPVALGVHSWGTVHSACTQHKISAGDVDMCCFPPLVSHQMVRKGLRYTARIQPIPWADWCCECGCRSQVGQCGPPASVANFENTRTDKAVMVT